MSLACDTFDARGGASGAIFVVVASLFSFFFDRSGERLCLFFVAGITAVLFCLGESTARGCLSFAASFWSAVVRRVLDYVRS